MAVSSGAASTGKPPPKNARLLTVLASRRITPNMIRVTLGGPDLRDIPADCAGGHCKLFLPRPEQGAEDFARQLAQGPRPVARTYTVRHARPEAGEVDIDFVAHGADGPASAWAEAASPGDVCGFAGPGAPKLTQFDADWYLIAVDMSGLPVASAALEALPRDASGHAIFEVPNIADRQEIAAPPGIQQHWLVHSDPHAPSGAQIDLIGRMEWPAGRARTLIAGETGVVRALRLLTRGERGVARTDSYASGYWRIGLAEDQHQKVKRAETEADEAALARPEERGA